MAGEQEFGGVSMCVEGNMEAAVECRDDGVTILFVEDEAFVRARAYDVLRSAGYWF